jgi:hypothetical protein
MTLPRLHSHHALLYLKVNKNMYPQYHDVTYEIKADTVHFREKPQFPTSSRVTRPTSHQDTLHTLGRPLVHQVEAVFRHLLYLLFSRNHPPGDNHQTNVRVGRKSDSAARLHHPTSETCLSVGDPVNSGYPVGLKRKLSLVRRPVPETSPPSVSHLLAQGTGCLISQSILSVLVEMPNV